MTGRRSCGCEIDTPGYKDAKRWGTLLKVHGSMNWIYCSACDRLEIGIDKRGETYNVAYRLAQSLVQQSPDLQDYYQGRTRAPARCRSCGGEYRPVMITPTHLKDYRNPHIAALWHRAERELQACTHVIFVGYSLPWDDVDVIYLLKRGLLRRHGRDAARDHGGGVLIQACTDRTARRRPPLPRRLRTKN